MNARNAASLDTNDTDRDHAGDDDTSGAWDMDDIQLAPTNDPFFD